MGKPLKELHKGLLKFEVRSLGKLIKRNVDLINECAKLLKDHKDSDQKDIDYNKCIVCQVQNAGHGYDTMFCKDCWGE